MAVRYEHVPHPRIASRKAAGPPKTADEHVGVNGRIALALTTAVGTMWCAYAFGILALFALPAALGLTIFPDRTLTIVTWISQTFIQLVMLSVIMVGQNVQSAASDKRAQMTYEDADAVLHEALQIQEHLKAQDASLTELMDKVAALEARLQAAGGSAG
ncbi:MAG TPA: hypothetical protein VEY67_11100 [Candidatus Dormibacteraeota bacterium]|nr:hypothetical protein [Candidatus Dormibacteraeota bacterium]